MSNKSESWTYESLRWIHEAREQHYLEEKGIPLGKIRPVLTSEAEKIAKRVNLQPVPEILYKKRIVAGL